jgi:hypothetical protein
MWFGVAIDFDNGLIWGGTWNKRQHVMEWGAGSNPATGTLPAMTFTASTTMRICVILGNAAGTDQRIVMVENQNNLIGLPSGFTPWGGTIALSTTATPSGTSSGGSGIGNIWPFGIVQ